MECRGYCKKCQAPVFFNETTDWFGNTVTTLNCWNGHYKWINIKDLEELAADPETNVVTYIGFFDLK